MSTHKLLNAYSDIKSWSKQLDQDASSFYNANDFELALNDYSLLKNPNRYKENFKDLNWFLFDKPSLYSPSLESYASYLTYVIAVQIFTKNALTIDQYETYFTNQLVGFLADTKDLSRLRNLSEITKYWKRTLSTLEYLVNRTTQYEKVVPYSSIYFNCNDTDNYRIEIPLLGFKNSGEPKVDCILILPYFQNKPSWYTIPGLYKIYSYFAEHNISVENTIILWFDVSDHLKDVVIETIPLTPNVAEMVSRYSCLQPYPFKNIFNKSNKEYYNKTPLEVLLK